MFKKLTNYFQVDIECPKNNGEPYTTSNGAVLTVQCTTDHYGGDYESHQVASYEDCLELCSTHSLCKAISFHLTNNICYLKSNILPGSDNQGVWSAVLVSAGTGTDSGDDQKPSSTALTGTPSSSDHVSTINCPRENGLVRSAASLEKFIIECLVDRGGGDIPGRAPAWTDSFQACINVCGAVDACRGVSWDNSYPGVNKPCYLKQDLNPPVQNSNIWAARKYGSAAGDGAGSAAGGSSTATPGVSGPVSTATVTEGASVTASTTRSFSESTGASESSLSSSSSSSSTTTTTTASLPSSESAGDGQTVVLTSTIKSTRSHGRPVGSRTSGMDQSNSVSTMKVTSSKTATEKSTTHWDQATAVTVSQTSTFTITKDPASSSVSSPVVVSTFTGTIDQLSSSSSSSSSTLSVPSIADPSTPNTSSTSTVVSTFTVIEESSGTSLSSQATSPPFVISPSVETSTRSAASSDITSTTTSGADSMTPATPSTSSSTVTSSPPFSSQSSFSSASSETMSTPVTAVTSETKTVIEGRTSSVSTEIVTTVQATTERETSINTAGTTSSGGASSTSLTASGWPPASMGTLRTTQTPDGPTSYTTPGSSHTSTNTHTLVEGSSKRPGRPSTRNPRLTPRPNTLTQSRTTTRTTTSPAVTTTTKTSQLSTSSFTTVSVPTYNPHTRSVKTPTHPDATESPDSTRLPNPFRPWGPFRPWESHTGPWITSLSSRTRQTPSKPTSVPQCTWDVHQIITGPCATDINGPFTKPRIPVPALPHLSEFHTGSPHLDHHIPRSLPAGHKYPAGIHGEIPPSIQNQFQDQEINYWAPFGSEYYYAQLCVSCEIIKVVADTGTYKGQPECNACEPPVMQARAGSATYLPTVESGICGYIEFQPSICVSCEQKKEQQFWVPKPKPQPPVYSTPACPLPCPEPCPCLPKPEPKPKTDTVTCWSCIQTPVYYPTTLTKERYKTVKIPTPVQHFLTTKETEYITKSISVTTPAYRTKTEHKIVTTPIFKTSVDSKVITTPVYVTKVTTKVVPTTELIVQTILCNTCPDGKTTTVSVHKMQTTATTHYVTCERYNTVTLNMTVKTKETEVKSVPYTTTIKAQETLTKSISHTETKSVPYVQTVTATEKCENCSGGYTTTLKTYVTQPPVVSTQVVTLSKPCPQCPDGSSTVVVPVPPQVTPVQPPAQPPIQQLSQPPAQPPSQPPVQQPPPVQTTVAQPCKESPCPPKTEGPKGSAPAPQPSAPKPEGPRPEGPKEGAPVKQPSAPNPEAPKGSAPAPSQPAPSQPAPSKPAPSKPAASQPAPPTTYPTLTPNETPSPSPSLSTSESSSSGSTTHKPSKTSPLSPPKETESQRSASIASTRPCDVKVLVAVVVGAVVAVWGM
ncbi:hypothetical protein MPH_09839 [Macrophomina phaseolina MS6]|uniref:Apple domain-containing protein n=1 Tax=Macrophomina phaseolina (strain MS6) TaxID=1126212 RepID=K2RS30_MACPH|nr:hypothetical protein MPH_09839 [Macrophomina phaseolina MS6]